MLSVVMRTYNNIDIVSNTIASLYSQQNICFEFIVIDSGSNDGTLELVQEKADQVISIKSSEYTPSYALNLAISKATYDIVLLLNSDTVILDPFVVTNMLKKFKNDQLDVLTGRQVARPDSHAEVRAEYLKSFPIDSELPDWISMSAPIAMISHDAWKKNPFYEEAWGSEDTMFGKKLASLGYRLGYASECKAMHSHNYSLKQLFNRASIEGDADVFIDGKSFDVLYFIRALCSETARHINFNLRKLKIRGLNLSVPLTKALGYNYGIYKGTKRKKNKTRKLFYKSYQ